MAQEPRSNYTDGGLTLDTIKVISDLKRAQKAWKAYKGSRRFGSGNTTRLSYPKFFERWAAENMAQGGSAGQLVQNTADG